MANEGIKLALPGIDADKASDADLIFSSSWPVMQIAKQVFIPSSNASFTGNLAPMYQHKLGFNPAFIPYGNSGATSGGSSANKVQLYANISRQNLCIDDQYLYFIQPGGATGFPSTGLLIFNIDLEKLFIAPDIAPGFSSNLANAKDWGIKIAKENYDVYDQDLRHFIIHSSARSPLIHAVIPGLTQSNGDGTYSFSYIHSLPYKPMFTAYVKTPNTKNTYVLINGYAGLSTNGNTLKITTSSQQQCSFVILKDPFLINDAVYNVKI